MKPKLVHLVAAAALLGGAASVRAEEPLVGYISPIAAQPGQQLINAAIESVAKERGWSYRVLDANLSADRQVSHLDTMLTLGAKVVGTWSLDANTVAAAYARAAEQGVPIIGLNTKADNIAGTVWWETNLCQPGGPYDRQAAWIKERQPGAKVIVFGGPPVESIINNAKCFTEAAKAAGLEVIDRVDNTKDNTSNAASLAADEFVRFPDVQAFWAYNDSSALGISAAAIAAGKTIYGGGNTDGVMVFGINGDEDAIAAVKEGRITGTWDPDPYASGMAIALDMVHAITEPGALKKDIAVQAQFFTSDNIDTWKRGDQRGYTIDTIPLVK